MGVVYGFNKDGFKLRYGSKKLGVQSSPLSMFIAIAYTLFRLDDMKYWSNSFQVTLCGSFQVKKCNSPRRQTISICQNVTSQYISTYPTFQNIECLKIGSQKHLGVMQILLSSSKIRHRVKAQFLKLGEISWVAGTVEVRRECDSTLTHVLEYMHG